MGGRQTDEACMALREEGGREGGRDGGASLFSHQVQRDARALAGEQVPSEVELAERGPVRGRQAVDQVAGRDGVEAAAGEHEALQPGVGLRGPQGDTFRAGSRFVGRGRKGGERREGTRRGRRRRRRRGEGGGRERERGLDGDQGAPPGRPPPRWSSAPRVTPPSPATSAAGTTTTQPLPRSPSRALPAASQPPSPGPPPHPPGPQPA